MSKGIMEYNAYEELGIEKDATEKEIKKAYTKLIREFTPEKYPEKFEFLRKMYERISDKYERAAHDAYIFHRDEFNELFGYVKMAEEEEDYETAIASVETILDIQPNFIFAKRGLAVLLRKDRQYEEAEVILTELIEKGYYVPESLYDLADCVINSNREDKLTLACEMCCTAYGLDNSSIEKLEEFLSYFDEVSEEECVKLCRCFLKYVPDEIDTSYAIYPRAISALCNEREYEFIREVKERLLKVKDADTRMIGDMFTYLAYYFLGREVYEVAYFCEELGYSINNSRYQERLRENLNMVKELEYVTESGLRKAKENIWDVVRNYIIVYGRFENLDKDYMEENREWLKGYFWREAAKDLESSMYELIVLEGNCKEIGTVLEEAIGIFKKECKHRDSFNKAMKSIAADEKMDNEIISLFENMYVLKDKEMLKEQIKKFVESHAVDEAEKMFECIQNEQKEFLEDHQECFNELYRLVQLWSMKHKMNVVKSNKDKGEKLGLFNLTKMAIKAIKLNKNLMGK